MFHDKSCGVTALKRCGLHRFGCSKKWLAHRREEFILEFYRAGFTKSRLQCESLFSLCASPLFLLQLFYSLLHQRRRQTEDSCLRCSSAPTSHCTGVVPQACSYAFLPEERSMLGVFSVLSVLLNKGFSSPQLCLDLDFCASYSRSIILLGFKSWIIFILMEIPGSKLGFSQGSWLRSIITHHIIDLADIRYKNNNSNNTCIFTTCGFGVTSIISEVDHWWLAYTNSDKRPTLAMSRFSPSTSNCSSCAHKTAHSGSFCPWLSRFTQMDCDGHLAQCLSEMNADMTW